MLIGSWGPIVFQVSGIGAFTFSELTQNSSGRWAAHETINSVPLSEFLGPGQDEIQMNISITKLLGGINPQITYELFRQLVRGGKNYPLILGGIPVSDNFWYVETISGSSTKFFPGTGDVLWTEFTCNFKEYK
jgi:phage protein U